MEFISAEEFSKQSDKVQKVFLEWWNPSIGDICAYKMGSNIKKYYLWKMVCITSEYDIKGKLHDIPLLTEGQLRKFIEDNTYCKLNIGTIGNIIKIYEKELDIPFQTDLLQAYWKVAIQIAEQEGKKND